MATHNRDSRLTAVLDEPSGGNTWMKLWELFADWPDGPDKDEAITRANAVLARWEDRVRLAQSSWPTLYTDDRVGTIGRLVRTIEVYRRGDAGAYELVKIADSPNIGDLHHLILHRCEIEHEQAFAALGNSHHLRSLTSLRMYRTPLLGHLTALLRATGLPALTSLELVDADIRDRDMSSWAQAPLLDRLTHLDLSHNAIGDDGARVLAELPELCHLATLNLSGNRITAEGRRVVEAAPQFAGTELIF